MYARVARWEGADGATVRRSYDELRARAESGPPEGVPAVGLLALFDAGSGTNLAITLFETEEDMRTGDATLNDMSPGDDLGRRVSVEFFEVAADLRAPSRAAG